MMTLSQLLNEGKLKAHQTSPEEIQGLLKLAHRDIESSQVEGLDADWRFTIAYNAIMSLATIPLLIKGYKTVPAKGGHHYITIESLLETMNFSPNLVRYFHVCRSKRHATNYDSVSNIGDNEVDELLSEAEGFEEEMFSWLRRSHPQFLPK